METLIRRERLVITTGLFVLTALAWAWLLHLAHTMHGATATAGMAITHPAAMPWGAADLTVAFAMWAVMMVAMMLPSAAPMILTFAGVNRRRGAGPAPVPTSIFVAGYVAVWTAFSAAATLGQWGLQRAALLSPDAMRAVPWVGGVLLVAAGVYQLTPFKEVCLARCQSPLHFVLTSWRDGTVGALVMGLRHGASCVGCCWALMALLFVAGVMNLAWVAALAALVLVEKVTPMGRVVGVVGAVLAIGWGALLVVRGI